METGRNDESNEWEEVQECVGYRNGLTDIVKDTLVITGIIAAIYGLSCFSTYYVRH